MMLLSCLCFWLFIMTPAALLEPPGQLQCPALKEKYWKETWFLKKLQHCLLAWLKYMHLVSFLTLRLAFCRFWSKKLGKKKK